MKSHSGIGGLILAVFAVACRSDSSKFERVNVDSNSVAVAPTPPVTAVAPQERPQPQAPADSPPPKPWPLACSPDTIRPGDTVTLRMSTPHGDDLTIVRLPVGANLSDFERSRDRIFYNIIDPYANKTRTKYSLMPAEQFREVAVLRLPTDVRAPPQVYGRDSALEPVFSKPGKYEIWVGENLASDYSNVVTQCTVTLTMPKD